MLIIHTYVCTVLVHSIIHCYYHVIATFKTGTSAQFCSGINDANKGVQLSYLNDDSGRWVQITYFSDTTYFAVSS